MGDPIMDGFREMQARSDHQRALHDRIQNALADKVDALRAALRELTDAAKQITPLLTDQNVHALRLEAAIKKAEKLL